MFLQRSRGVFTLRLFWRSGLRPGHFLRKQGFWKSAVHQLLLNHPVRAELGQQGPSSTLSRAQCPVWAWPGQESTELGDEHAKDIRGVQGSS